MKKTIFLIILTLAVVAFWLYSPVIFQEGNPSPQLGGILKLNLGREKFVKLNTAGIKFMSKSKHGNAPLMDFMLKTNYQFIEQMGAGYVFLSPLRKNFIVTHRQYTKFYSIWNFPQNASETKSAIAEQIRECMPLSNWQAHERCLALLAQINNYDDCVNAGFDIMKSNPPQCALPDGRNFVQKVNR